MRNLRENEAIIKNHRVTFHWQPMQPMRTSLPVTTKIKAEESSLLLAVREPFPLHCSSRIESRTYEKSYCRQVVEEEGILPLELDSQRHPKAMIFYLF